MSIKNSLKNEGNRITSMAKRTTKTPVEQLGKIPRYKTTGNAKSVPLTYEFNSGQSETVPNQTMSVKDILNRFTGISYPQSRKLQHYGEQFVYDISEFKRLDISEQQEVIKEARRKTMETIKALRRKGELEKEKQTEEFYKSKFKDEFEKTMAKQSLATSSPSNDSQARGSDSH